MTFEIQYAAEVELDLKEICSWYESQQPGLYDKFERWLNECVDRIGRVPFIGEEVHSNIRKRRIKHFQYFVLYRIKDSLILILGVFHFKQDPARWEERFSLNGH